VQDTNRQPAAFEKDLLHKSTHFDALRYITIHAKSMIGAERCSVFVYLPKEDKLSTILADGEEKIVMPYDLGIVGEAIRIKKSIIENEPYSNPNFLADVDMQTGYYTQNILTTPIFNVEHEVVGALQLLNKKEGFTKADAQAITSFAEEISDFISAYTPQESTDDKTE